MAVAAAVLFVLGLAYWWQGNLFHEVVGTLFVVLLILHNVTVLRWYAALGKGKWTVRRTYSTLVNVSILTLMLALASTSLMVSQSLYAGLPFNVGYSARDAHVLVAYWALVVMGLHMGLHWSRVLSVFKRVVPKTPWPVSRILARCIPLLIAIYGIQSTLVMLLPEKLTATPALEMWDFTVDAGAFFLRYAAIVGLFAVVGHYLAIALQRVQRTATRG